MTTTTATTPQSHHYPLRHWDDGGRMFRLNLYWYVCQECGWHLEARNPGFVPDHEQKEIELGLTSWAQTRNASTKD